MLKSKTLDRIACASLALMLALTAVVWIGKAAAGPLRTVEVGYEGLFDASVVHAIDIEMADWDGFIATATQEEYVECAVTIDGEKLSNVAIRAKGNTSLSSVAGLGSQKYSFKLEFDHFVKGRQYRGLDKLSLNNLIYDATMMKDYLAYTLMGKMGVPAPLCAFVQVNVNGEPWGLYLAVEGVEDGFLERNRMTQGELYKPDSMSFGGGRGNGRDFDADEFQENLRQMFENRDEDGADGADGDFGASFGGQNPNGFGSFGGQAMQDESAAAPDPAATASPAQTAAPDAGMGGGFGASGGFPAQGDSAPGGELSGMNGGSFGGAAPAAEAPMPGAQADPTPAPNAGTASQGATLPEGFNFPSDARQEGRAGGFGGFGGGFGMGSSDVKLQYIDDDPASYGNIFNNAKTKITQKDQTRLIDALQHLSAEENIESTVFTDEVIRYLAVHSFLCNDDSYTGSIVHNYYLYEENGRLAIIPWDYNLAFGGQSMGGSGASGQINAPIDSPVTNGNVSDRPLVAWIFADESATARYHEIYDEFIRDVIESGWLEAEIDRVAALIRPYVAADTQSFFTVDAFDTAVQTMQAFCALRGKSIRGQLEGEIPSTSAGQSGSAALVDASGVDLSAMGSMGGGRGGFGGGNFGGFNGQNAEGQEGASFGGQAQAGDGQQQGGSFGGSAGSRGGSAQQTPSPEGGGDAQTPGGASFGGQASPAPSPGNPGAAPTAEDTGKATEAPASPAEAGLNGDRSGNRTQRNQGGAAFSGFTPPGDAQEAAQPAMSWLELGLWAAALLLALLLIARAPGHQR